MKLQVGDIIKKHNVRGNYSIGQIVSIVAGEYVVEVIKTVRNGRMVPKKTSVSHEYFGFSAKNVGSSIEVIG
jgi:hypothetical protein